jgi:hypothetical protein
MTFLINLLLSFWFGRREQFENRTCPYEST